MSKHKESWARYCKVSAYGQASPEPAPKLSWAQQRRAEPARAGGKARQAKRRGMAGVPEARGRPPGLKALRVRGAPAVGLAIHLKVTGWHRKSAAAILRQRAGRLARAQVAPRAGQNGVPGGLKKTPRKDGVLGGARPPVATEAAATIGFHPGRRDFPSHRDRC